MPTKKVIGVIGKGNASLNVIEDSLSELVNDSIFVLPWYGGKPDASLDRVYTAIIDFGHDYIMVGNRIPRSVLKDAKDWEDTEDTNSAVLNYVQRLEGEKSLLVLWDDAPETEDALLKAHAIGIRLLDLTNALAPIDVVDVQEVEETPVVEETVEESKSEAFTEAELRSQPIASLRRQAKLLGIEFEKPPTKEQLINALLNGFDDVGLLEPALINETVATSVVINRADGSSVAYMFHSEKIAYVENLLNAVQLLAM